MQNAKNEQKLNVTVEKYKEEKSAETEEFDKMRKISTI